MRLALFDLDNTLLGGDSDHAWGDYLCQRGILDGDAYKARNDASIRTTWPASWTTPPT